MEWVLKTIDFFFSPEFTTKISLIADIAIVFLAAYTLHITAFSRKLRYVSISFSTSMFYGNTMALTFMNKSLHALPLQKVRLLKKDKDGYFLYLAFADYSDPVTIDSWGVNRIEIEPFTQIESWNDGKKWTDYHEKLQDAIICLEVGNKWIWVKPYKKAPLREAKKAYKKGLIKKLTVSRKKYDGVILSENVDCQISIRMKDLNGQFVLMKTFGITGFNHGKNLCLEKEILGYNAIPCAGTTAREITEAIHECFGIRKDDILVQMIGNTILGV